MIVRGGRMKWVMVALGVAILISGLFYLKTSYVAGEFKQIEPHFSGTYGYYQTQWGAFPSDYGYSSGSSFVVHSTSQEIDSPTPLSPDVVPMVPPAAALPAPRRKL